VGKPESATLDFVESTNHAHLEPLTPDIRRRVAHTCEQVAAGLSTLAYEIVREIPDYALVPVREHQEWVTDTARVLLAGIAEQQLPRPEHVRHARELGCQRALQGLAIELLLGAYHITYRESVECRLRQTTTQDPELAGRLACLVNLIRTWVRTITSSASSGWVACPRQPVRRVSPAPATHPPPRRGRLGVASSAPSLIREPLRRECLGSVRRPPPGAVRTAETGCAEP
jgi:hypothetical protein